MSEQYKNQLLPYIARKQKLYLYNIRHIFSISCQKHFLEGIFLEMVKTVTFRNPPGSLHGNFNNFDTNDVMPEGKFEKFLPPLTISLQIIPAVPYLLKVQSTERCKNTVPLCVPPTAPHNGANHGTSQKYCSVSCSVYRPS